MSGVILCIGDNVVDVYVDDGLMYPGGNAVNVSVHLSRLGVRAAYVGVLGDDAAGEAILEALQAEGVDTTRTRVHHGTTAYALVHLVDGDRLFAPGSVGVSRFAPDEGDLRLAAGAQLVHTGECSMLEAHLPALRTAASFLSFDFSERPWEYVEEYAPQVDLAILSRPATGEEEPLEVARKVLALGPTQVVVSAGAGGAVWTDGSREVKALAPHLDVVDTLGAGDALIARVLSGIASGVDPDIYLPAATAYATASCAQRGAFGHSAPLGFTTSSPDTSERQE